MKMVTHVVSTVLFLVVLIAGSFNTVSALPREDASTTEITDPGQRDLLERLDALSAQFEQSAESQEESLEQVRVLAQKALSATTAVEDTALQLERHRIAVVLEAQGEPYDLNNDGVQEGTRKRGVGKVTRLLQEQAHAIATIDLPTHQKYALSLQSEMNSAYERTTAISQANKQLAAEIHALRADIIKNYSKPKNTAQAESVTPEVKGEKDNTVVAVTTAATENMAHQLQKSEKMVHIYRTLLIVTFLALLIYMLVSLNFFLKWRNTSRHEPIPPDPEGQRSISADFISDEDIADFNQAFADHKNGATGEFGTPAEPKKVAANLPTIHDPIAGIDFKSTGLPVPPPPSSSRRAHTPKVDYPPAIFDCDDEIGFAPDLDITFPPALPAEEHARPPTKPEIEATRTVRKPVSTSHFVNGALRTDPLNHDLLDHDPHEVTGEFDTPQEVVEELNKAEESAHRIESAEIAEEVEADAAEIDDDYTSAEAGKKSQLKFN